MKRRPYIGLILILLFWFLAVDLFGATITSNGTGGGSFRKGATWVGGTPPGDGDLVVIAAGDSVWFNADVDTNFTIGNDGTGDLDISGKLTCINSGEIDTLFMKGGISVNNGGSFIIDKSSDGANYFIIIMDCSSDGEHGIVVDDGGIIDWDGAVTLYATQLNDADAAASDLTITVDGDITGWQVDDELVIEGDVAGETEKVVIASIAGQVVTIDAPGLVNQHDDDRKVINITRNVKLQSSNPSFDTYVRNETTTKANFDVQYCEFRDMNSASGKRGLYFNGGYGLVSYCSFYNGDRGIQIATSAINAIDLTYNVFYNMSSAGCYFGNAAKTILSNCYFMDCLYSIYSYVALEIEINNIYSCDANNAAMRFGSNNTAKGSNNISRTSSKDIMFATDVDYVAMYFDGSNFSSATIVSGQAYTIGGSYVRLNNFNSNADDNRSYESFGTIRSTGAGLADTEVRTAGSLALKMTPNNASNALEWEFTVACVSGEPMALTGYLYCTDRPANASSDIESSVSISGCGMTEDTHNFTIETDQSEDTWIQWTVSGTPTRNGLATVKVSCYDFSATNPDYYIDDIVVASTAIELGRLDYWYRGLPAPILLSTGIGAMDIWKSLFGIDYGNGSMGEGVKNVIRRTPK